MKPIFLSTIILCLLANLVTAQSLTVTGQMKDVMHGKDLSATVQLDSLIQQPYLYGLGAVEGLQGEITVFNGSVYVSTVENGEIQTRVDPFVKAAFLGYAYEKEWEKIVLTEDVQSLDQLEQTIDRIATEEGWASKLEFAFYVEGQWSELKHHIIMKDPEDEAQGKTAHERAKNKFTEKNIEGTLIGFFSPSKEGLFTHKGKKIHAHFLAKDRSFTAHVEDIQLKGPAVLMVPK